VVEFQPNLDAVVKVMLDTGAGPSILEQANQLVEKWIAERVCFDKRVMTVETGFDLWLDENTVIIGVQDLVTEEDGARVGCEWKTTKGTTRFWNEEKWLESISTSPQCAIYALVTPVIRVCAVTKSDPPEIWGNRLLTFPEERLNAVRNALLNQAAAIRTMRKLKLLPWALPGVHCVNQFRRECEFLAECKAQQYPATIGAFDPDNPAYKLVIPRFGDRIHDSELVILSASSYNDSMDCMEKYRRNLAGEKSSAPELEVGTVFHTAAANIYQQLKEFQNGNNEPCVS
jgi:hypothetical protein